MYKSLIETWATITIAPWNYSSIAVLEGVRDLDEQSSKKEESLLQLGEGSSHTSSRNKIALGSPSVWTWNACAAFAEVSISFPIIFEEAPQFLKRTNYCTNRERCVPAVSSDLDLSALLDRTVLQMFDQALVQYWKSAWQDVVTQAFWIDCLLFNLYRLCSIDKAGISLETLHIGTYRFRICFAYRGEFQFSCRDEHLSHQSAVAAIFIPLSAEHWLSDSWVTS